jgi:hypothetical protein
MLNFYYIKFMCFKSGINLIILSVYLYLIRVVIIRLSNTIGLVVK